MLLSHTELPHTFSPVRSTLRHVEVTQGLPQHVQSQQKLAQPSRCAAGRRSERPRTVLLSSPIEQQSLEEDVQPEETFEDDVCIHERP